MRALVNYQPSSKQFQKFHEYFGIQDTPTNIEKEFYAQTYKYIKYIQWIPGIRMIGIGNTIAMNCARGNSDIDLYIVTAPRRMWLVRILFTLIFQVLGVRKTPKHHAGRFCLSFFSTTKGMNFSSFALENDIYLYFWVLYFKPIVNINDTYEQFIQQNSSWADFSQYSQVLDQNKNYIQYSDNLPRTNICSKIGDICDTILKKIFLPKTLRHSKRIGNPYGIIISDDMLKFHNGDIRKKLQQQFLKKTK